MTTAPRTTSKHCLYCGSSIQKGTTKAKEHVLKKSWLEKLGHSRSKLSFGMWSLKLRKHVGSRQQPAATLLAGDVCAKCNSGWMNRVDGAVEASILALARGARLPQDLSTEERRALARWILKTACAFEYCEEPDRRHIPEHVRRRLEESDYLPSGFVLFAVPLGPGTRAVHPALMRGWFKTDSLGEVEKARNFKFAVQYDEILIGCALLLEHQPTFSGIHGVHVPLLSNDASFVARPDTPEQRTTIAAFDRAPINDALAWVHIEDFNAGSNGPWAARL